MTLYMYLLSLLNKSINFNFTDIKCLNVSVNNDLKDLLKGCKSLKFLIKMWNSEMKINKLFTQPHDVTEPCPLILNAALVNKWLNLLHFGNYLGGKNSVQF